ncbi:MAG: sigma-70 family RNA polymerase sigma factor [Candidatus Aminicenantes bacterium]|nr:sigma-70 family RNA polymerase sigma factor [Candidatus Aminicenantes bacterium]
MEMDDESQLVLKAQEGNVEAFMILAKKYEQPVFRLLYRLTKNREDAADLTQETMLKAFRAIKEFKLKSSFNTWLHRIAVNLALNFIKKHQNQKSQMEYLDNLKNEEQEVPVFSSPEEVSISEEFRINLEKAIEELPLAYRTTFSLIVFQGMSHQEAARILGCSENTVSWRMHEARKMLKERLKPFLNLKQEV